ncbi:MAG: ABC-2 type transporter, partial [uncultured Solirubrobacteraceae bacterium]
ERGADPLRRAAAPRGQPLHEDQAPDRRRAAAGDLPLHLGVRRRARLAHRRARGHRLRRVHRARPHHDGLGDQRVLEQLLLDPPAEDATRDRRPALLSGVATGAAARVLLRRLRARDARRHADVQRRVGPRRHPDRAPARAPARAVPRRILLLPARGARRHPRRAVRRPLLRTAVRPAAAHLPRRRLLLRVAAATAVRDDHPAQPRLLHDRAGALRLPGLHRRERGAVVAVPRRGHRRAVRREPAAVPDGASPAGL